MTSSGTSCCTDTSIPITGARADAAAVADGGIDANPHVGPYHRAAGEDGAPVDVGASGNLRVVTYGHQGAGLCVIFDARRDDCSVLDDAERADLDMRADDDAAEVRDSMLPALVAADESGPSAPMTLFGPIVDPAPMVTREHRRAPIESPRLARSGRPVRRCRTAR